MTIVHLSGGFGNQLFSYAFGYAVAKARNEKLVIDTAIQDAPWFFRNPDILKMNIVYDRRLTYPIGRSLFERALLNKIRFRMAIGATTSIITENDVKIHDNPINYCVQKKGNIYLKGNWGNESWFVSVYEEIKKHFEFKEELTGEAKKIADDITKCPQSVTMHVRRGDYVKIGVALEKQYFLDAMAYMASVLDNPVFYCFSEDLEWAKNAFENTAYDIRYMQYESEDKGIDDFRLLSLGKHQIISNSSYSWWAAYLNKNAEKKVIIPCKEGTTWDKEFVVNGWIPMEFTVNGKCK